MVMTNLNRWLLYSD